MPTPPSPTYTDLEIRILAREARGYPVEFTVAGRQFPRDYLDASALPETSIADASAGEQLYRWLLADPGTKEAWDKATGVDGTCRIRLRLDATAPELHVIRWELLQQPVGAGRPAVNLAAAARTPFSRFPALALAPARQIIDDKLRVLVAVADPDDLADIRLAPIERAVEFGALHEALASLPVELTLLDGPCTLTAIEAALRRGYHALHFIGHGHYTEKLGPALILADRHNRTARTRAGELADMVARLAGPDNPLQLVFLASCQTAETSPADAFRGLAPQLLQAGIPAVVAMQDMVPVRTAREFATTFYSQLMQHGVVDLAANQARAALMTARLPGAAVPVLFMRVPDGRLLDRSALFKPPIAASILHALARGHLPENPFSETLPIRDPVRFVGREPQMRRLHALLSGGSVALVGEPRIGKSSLLWQLADRWPEKVIGPIDCMDMEGPDDLYERLAEQLGTDDANWRSLRRALREVSALILIDEMDAGALRGLTYADIGRFRSVCQFNRGLRVAAVSRLPLKDVFHDPGLGSRAYDFLHPLSLGPLTEGEARILLAHPWVPQAPTFDASTIEQLLALASGHPFMLQRLAFHRYEAMADTDHDWRTAYKREMEHIL